MQWLHVQFLDRYQFPNVLIEKSKTCNSLRLICDNTAKLIIELFFNNCKQEVILGRTVTITRNGNSVGIKDVSSGMTISGQGSTPEVIHNFVFVTY